MSVGELTPEVSLADDLAADSLDLLDLALALEAEFGIVVPERVLDRVRSYGDLVATTVTLMRAQRAAETRSKEPPPRFWTHLVPRAGPGSGTLERAGWLTPYTAQAIADDALRAGRGAWLEVTVAPDTTDATLAHTRNEFARLRNRGVRVSVRRGAPPQPERVYADGVAPGTGPEQLCLPLRDSPTAATPWTDGFAERQAPERAGADRERRHGPQPARHDEARGRRHRALPGDDEAG